MHIQYIYIAMYSDVLECVNGVSVYNFILEVLRACGGLLEQRVSEKRERERGRASTGVVKRRLRPHPLDSFPIL